VTVEELREKCQPYMQVRDNEEESLDNFWKLNSYVKGTTTPWKTSKSLMKK
jgi:hypothetical protein